MDHVDRASVITGEYKRRVVLAYTLTKITRPSMLGATKPFGSLFKAVGLPMTRLLKYGLQLLSIIESWSDG